MEQNLVGVELEIQSNTAYSHKVNPPKNTLDLHRTNKCKDKEAKSQPMKKVTATIQARVGSSRLPGKVMYPLNGEPAIGHVTRRVQAAEQVTNVVVATSTEPQDEVIYRSAPLCDADVLRGSESDVLSRFVQIVEQHDPDIVVRITGDCPLIDPRTIDAVTTRLVETGSDYATNVLKRTFPRGLDVEAFTKNSFEKIQIDATEQHHREHVTPYYHENQDQFRLENVTSDEVFNQEWMHNRTDLRLTLDEGPDYEVLRQVYDNVAYDEILPIQDAVRYVDEQDLMDVNKHVNQKEI
ncbi:cytidylyltransferase domain-containing protein [Natronosalvus halobius]|uniref:cytidylyltransferase domain-containing protein n=1 Tax=Natronosalvus halobius TaxID=2953746 RepID=UPI00209F06F6|nr:glycosyltransferase family protein [Natronosalvus halobius]USZ71464.1 glycosyltransferase family protein [Natronosalvus halobius]